MAVLRSIYHVHVRGKGPSLLGNAPGFSGGRMDAYAYATEMVEKTGLPIIEMGANVPPISTSRASTCALKFSTKCGRVRRVACARMADR